MIGRDTRGKGGLVTTVFTKQQAAQQNTTPAFFLTPGVLYPLNWVLGGSGNGVPLFECLSADLAVDFSVLGYERVALAEELAPQVQ